MIEFKRTYRSVLDVEVVDLNLPIRVQNTLEMADIRTVEQVLKFSKQDYLKFRNFGDKSLKALEKAIEVDLNINCWL